MPERGFFADLGEALFPLDLVRHRFGVCAPKFLHHFPLPHKRALRLRIFAGSFQSAQLQLYAGHDIVIVGRNVIVAVSTDNTIAIGVVTVDFGRAVGTVCLDEPSKAVVNVAVAIIQRVNGERSNPPRAAWTDAVQATRTVQDPARIVAANVNWRGFFEILKAAMLQRRQ
jgi:hypothetical protein